MSSAAAALKALKTLMVSARAAALSARALGVAWDAATEPAAHDLTIMARRDWILRELEQRRPRPTVGAMSALLRDLGFPPVNPEREDYCYGHEPAEWKMENR